jgi:hypothetical protein
VIEHGKRMAGVIGFERSRAKESILGPREAGQRR